MNKCLKYEILRVVLVMLVVIGHATYYTIKTPFGGIFYTDMMINNNIQDTYFHTLVSLLTNWIYTFHMPAFFALSGTILALQIKNKGCINFKKFFIKKFKRLIVPLIFVWFFWNIPIKLVSGYYMYVNMEWKYILLQIFFPYNVYLWFLEALFISTLIIYVVFKYIKENQYRFLFITFLWIIGCFLEKLLGEYNPLGNPLKYVIWLWIGMYIENFVEKIKEWKISNIFLGVLIIIIQFFLWYELKDVKYINYICLNTLYPLLMIIALYIMINYYEKSLYEYKYRILSISTYSYGIYLYAEPLNYTIIYYFVTLFGINSLGSEYYAFILYFARIIISVSVAIIIIKIFKILNLKYFI